MNFPEFLWTVAYCLFLLGGAWTFLSGGAWSAIGLMAAGVLLDAAVAFLPQFGVDSLSYNLDTINSTMLLSMGAGITAYLLFFSGVVLRWRERRSAFYWCIAIAQPMWFLSFIGFLYALYIVSDAPLRCVE